MSESVYGKAPLTSIEMATTDTDVKTAKVHVSDTQKPSLVISEADSGISSKGFKRLLMFGKKNSGSSERNMESDKVTLEGSAIDANALNGSSTEGNFKTYLNDYCIFTFCHIYTMFKMIIRDYLFCSYRSL